MLYLLHLEQKVQHVTDIGCNLLFILDTGDLKLCEVLLL